MRASTVDVKIVKAYRGWRKFEGRSFADGFVRTKGYFCFKSYEDILKRFKELEKEALPRSAEGKFIRAKLVASIYYLRAKLGEPIDFFEYVERTIGIRPRTFPEKDIERQIGRIKAHLLERGIPYEKTALKKALFLHERPDAAFRRELEERKDVILKKAEAYVGTKLREPIGIEFVDMDAYWHYRIHIMPRGFSLVINTGKRTARKRGSLTYAIMHELAGHALQLGSWKKEIQRGAISEVCGCEEDYGPEIFSLEGVGEAIFHYVFRDDIDADLRTEMLFDELEHMVQNNAYIMVNTGVALKAAAAYYTERVLLARRSSVTKTLKEVRDDPFMRAYRPVYGLCLDFFRKAAAGMNGSERRRFFRMLYRRPMTYGQICEKYESIKKKRILRGET